MKESEALEGACKENSCVGEGRLTEKKIGEERRRGEKQRSRGEKGASPCQSGALIGLSAGSV